ncbi:MAG: hypothetical protein SVS15_11335 [Thermodesulfobacteriota bacterium]|nr:hypothetical protein [Thermodesulfobacteriota bacterium]
MAKWSFKFKSIHRKDAGQRRFVIPTVAVFWRLKYSVRTFRVALAWWKWAFTARGVWRV